MIWKDKDAVFFRHMSLLWFLPSIGALVILGISMGRDPLSLERVVAGLILGAHIFLIYRWVTAPSTTTSGSQAELPEE